MQGNQDPDDISGLLGVIESNGLIFFLSILMVDSGKLATSS